MRYVVVDVETTGIYPGGHDRIVEVAVVGLGADLCIETEFCSLLNPRRDLGPSWLHGIRAADVLEAPEFEHLAGLIVDAVRDSIIVGHNVTFDLRFLESEFTRLGVRIQRPPYVDTMSFAVQLGAPSRCLEEACDLFGIPTPEDHSALADARATAALFTRCVQHVGADKLDALTRWPAAYDPRWPRLDGNGTPWPRAKAAERRRSEVPFLAKLVRDLPVTDGDPGDWHAYYAVLDRVLEDRRITKDEESALKDVVVEAVLSAEDVRAANENYLRTLVATALHDHVLSESERRDLEEVARLLALEFMLPELLEDGGDQASASQVPQIDRELKGRTVCFTGAMCASIDGERATRERATEVAESFGMIVVKGVTKKLDYLVMADPDSMSSKARKARAYGTRLLAESVFWNMVGVSTDG